MRKSDRTKLRESQDKTVLAFLKSGGSRIGFIQLEEIASERGREKISEPLLVGANGISTNKKEKRANLIREIHRQVVNVEDGQLIRAYQIVEGPSDLDEYRVQYYGGLARR